MTLADWTTPSGGAPRPIHALIACAGCRDTRRQAASDIHRAREETRVTWLIADRAISDNAALRAELDRLRGQLQPKGSGAHKAGGYLTAGQANDLIGEAAS